MFEKNILEFVKRHPGFLVGLLLGSILSGGGSVALNALVPGLRADAWTKEMDSKRMENYATKDQIKQYIELEVGKVLPDWMRNIENRLDQQAHRMEIIERTDAELAKDVQDMQREHEELDANDQRQWTAIRRHGELKAHDGAALQMENLWKWLEQCCSLQRRQ